MKTQHNQTNKQNKNAWKWKSLSHVLCDPMDYTVHGILQTRILEWVAFPFSRESSHPRDWTQVSRIAGGFFTSWAAREAQGINSDLAVGMDAWLEKGWGKGSRGREGTVEIWAELQLGTRSQCSESEFSVFSYPCGLSNACAQSIPVVDQVQRTYKVMNWRVVWHSESQWVTAH